MKRLLKAIAAVGLIAGISVGIAACAQGGYGQVNTCMSEKPVYTKGDVQPTYYK